MKRNRHKIRRIFSFQLRLLSFLNWFKLIIAIPIGLINADLISKTIDSAINGEVINSLTYAVIVFCLTLLYKIIQSLLDWVIVLKDMVGTQKCKIILYKAILASPLNLLFKSTNGEVIENLTNDIETITSSRKNIYPAFFTSLLSIIVYSIYIGMHNFTMIIALLLLSLLQIIPPIIIRKYMQINYDLNREIEAKITDFTIAGYIGMATIKLFSLENWYLEKFDRIHTEALKVGKKAELTGAAQTSMTSLANNLLQYGIYLVVGIIVLIQPGEMDIGIQVLALSKGLFDAVKTVFDCIPQISLVNKSEDRLSHWFFNEKQKGTFIEKSNYALIVDDVSYSYDSTFVFKNINLKIKNDELVVLKGRNGAGKTTFIRLVTGLLQAENGNIVFGKNKNNRSFWCETLFYMPQEDVVFDLTVSELCELFKCEPNDLGFEEWGLDISKIQTTNMTDLSGGERKKVYLALAFASDAQLLILDEPSNSLDIESKKILCEKLRMRVGATIVVSHDECFDVLERTSYRIEKGGIRIEEHN